MPCTIGHPTCDGFANGVGGWWGWVGLRDSADSGQNCGCCCGIGCENCSEEFLHEMVAFVDGSRWMRGSLDMVEQANPDAFDGRGARGHLIAVKQNEPRRVLAGWTADKAPCFYEGGLECYDNKGGLCDCDDRNFGCAFGNPDCPEIGGTCGGKRSDSFTRIGFDWLPSPQDFRCKVTTEIHEHVLRMRSKRLLQAIFVRDDYRQAGKLQGCTANRMSLCAGVNLNAANCGYQHPFVDPVPDGPHYIAPHHQMYNFVAIEYENIGLTNWGTPTPDEAIGRQIRNAALDKLATLESMSQLDYYPITGLPPNPSANAHLDDWHRSFGVGVPGDALIQQTKFMEFSNCHLARLHDVQVKVELFIREAFVSMSLVPNMTFDESIGLEHGFQVWPSARVRIYIVVGIKASFVGEVPPVVGDGDDAITLSIIHPNDYLSPPRIVPNIDSIVYVDGDQEFLPTRNVDWWGYHGHFGQTPWQPIENHLDQSNIRKCCNLATELDGLEIGAWPTHADGGATSTYTGRIRLGFITNDWCANCGAAHPDCNGAGGGAGQVGGVRFIPPLGIQPSPLVPSPIGRPPEIAEPPRIEPEPDTPIQIQQRPIAFNPDRFSPVFDPPIQQPDVPPNHKPPRFGPNEQVFEPSGQPFVFV